MLGILTNTAFLFGDVCSLTASFIGYIGNVYSDLRLSIGIGTSRSVNNIGFF